MREEKIGFRNNRGETLSGVIHHPRSSLAGGAVILCHGMDSNKNSEKLVRLAAELARRGMLALRFDFAYVGESSGKFEDITYSGELSDLQSAYGLVKSRRKGKIGIFGSSMGGTVALMLAAREPTVATVVSLAAPLHPEKFPARVLTEAQLLRWRERGYIIYNGQRFNRALLDDLEGIDVPACARRVACPVLILHGDADTIVPVEEAYELYGCLAQEKRLTILSGADHRFSNPETMQRALAETVDWLAEHIA
jgi:dipeptidyl aminopeptidase/acylaminoacyl peptidase